MISSGINMVMTVIGFAVSTLFIVFVCTRLICARIHLNVSSRSLSRTSTSDLSILERGQHGLEPLLVANFPTKKYRELCIASKENAQCTVCLSEYQKDDTLRILPVCGHSFHAKCIDIWLQQHSTCPVCRVSLREQTLSMQPMFSSAVRSQPLNAHYCRCMANGHRNDQVMDPTQEGRCAVDIGDIENSISVDHDRTSSRKVESTLTSR
ncbi:putative RING-H2 finger protein atl36 [Phtheirospermum japonicum]|uniref:RING-type E3 ubiquitin transferase n=1 Tax=Phtheirospermum japonicum TaxID=374723 RepID=A0A830CUV3_9LAMI|nr:putative RING-H2 finger protein atl36 [Phtheirospermum japonicum]